MKRTYKLCSGLTAIVFFSFVAVVYATPDERATLISAILDEGGNQAELVQKLVASNDELIAQTLAAWPKGGVFVQEIGGKKTPFILDPQGDEQNRHKAIRITDGEILKDTAGKPLLFLETDLTPVDTTRSLRKIIKQTLDLMALSNSDPNRRRDAANRLGSEQNLEYIAAFEACIAKEKDAKARKAFQEAVAITQLVSDDPAVKLKAVRALGELRSIGGKDKLREIMAVAQADPKAIPAEHIEAAKKSLSAIDDHLFWNDIIGVSFRGLSLGAVLLLAALGLAITFGLMGVINMAHGEMIMVGAYAAFVTHRWFMDDKLQPLPWFNWYFPVALVVAFCSAALLGLLLERSVIRFLYRRPLESLLATWGVSLILQQVFRATFGAANVSVEWPTWMRGSYETRDILFAYNRSFVIGFSALVVFATYLLLTHTKVGLQIRAVMQNRNMAACMGVRTDRMNMITFAFGSGLAGLAGACLSQIGNVGPSLGQSYIVDCFMVVVLGGVGNVIGTVTASLGMGLVDQFLQLNVQAVLAKVITLALVIVFLQWRPAGLFVTRSRSLES